MANFDFNQVDLLITHYNRSESCKRLVQNFDQLGCRFNQIVISDDGSKQEHLDSLRQIQSISPIKVVEAIQNGGLGANINKGQAACKSPYTLYVQEDFVPLPAFPEKLKTAISFMQSDRELDMVRFYAYTRYPQLKNHGQGFSTMVFDSNLFSLNYMKFYLYSDHPHLRRSDFASKFGQYALGLNPEKTEYEMMMSFLKNKGKALFYDDYQSLFEQKNTSSEPSTMKRNNIRRSENWLIARVRDLYRILKFNIDYRR